MQKFNASSSHLESINILVIDIHLMLTLNPYNLKKNYIYNVCRFQNLVLPGASTKILGTINLVQGFLCLMFRSLPLFWRVVYLYFYASYPPKFRWNPLVSTYFQKLQKLYALTCLKVSMFSVSIRFAFRNRVYFHDLFLSGASTKSECKEIEMLRKLQIRNRIKLCTLAL